MLDDEAELRVVLHHRHDRAAELGGQHRGLDVGVILEAVADDQPVRRVLAHRHDREQLGLAAGLETEPELRAAAEHLFDHQALLVDLDREHRCVTVAVIVLGDRAAEGIVQLAHTVAEDPGEAQHQWGGEVAGLEALHDIVEVDLAARLLLRAHHHMTALVDIEVALAPSPHMVELARSRDAPGRGRG